MGLSILDEALQLAAKAVLVDEPIDDQTGNERLSICESCDKFNQKHRKCTVCKCYMDVKCFSRINKNPKKLRSEVTHCPLGRWGDLEIANEYRKMDGVMPIQ